jgi:transposase-like protein
MKVNPPLERTPFDLFLWSRGYTNRAAAPLFGVSHEQVRLWRKPFSDPARVAPRPEERVLIANVTGGEVSPESFDPPEPDAPAAAVAA